MNIDEVYELCKIDKWFLNQIYEIIVAEKYISAEILNDNSLMKRIKSYGFSDKMIAHWLKVNENLANLKYIKQGSIWALRLVIMK